MKRKSGQHQSSKRSRKSDVAAANTLNIREGIGFAHLDIAPGQSVVFSGSATLEVTSGCLRVFGASVTPERGPVTLHAPSRHGRALLITAMAAEAQAPLAQSTAPVQAVLQSLLPASDGCPASFTIVDASSAGAPATWHVPQTWQQAVDGMSEALAANSAAAAAGTAVQPVVIAVTGSKGSGKSAFARLLVNSLLNSGGPVMYLDLDPGQPELTPAGLLSLHLLRQPLFGPAHMQQQPPLLAYFQGNVSSQSEPGLYLQAVQALCRRYYSMAAVQQQQQQPPLVMNTPGWITGLGLELLAEALRCAVPTHVVNMQSPNSKKNLPDGCWWLDSTAAAINTLPIVLQLPSIAGAAEAAAGNAAAVSAAGTTLSGQSGDTATTANPSGSSKSSRSLSAVEARALSWLSWARRIIAVSAAQANGAAATTAAAAAAATTAAAAAADEFVGAAVGLAAAVPYQVSLQDVTVQLQHAQVAASELPAALNGSIVGLVSSCCDKSPAQQQQVLQHQLVDAAGLSVARLPECLGLGLVRAVDAQQQRLYLLTDLEEDELQLVDTIVLGRLELPDKLQVTQQFASPYQGLFCLTTTATGAGVIKSRNNLLRASLLR